MSLIPQHCLIKECVPLLEAHLWGGHRKGLLKSYKVVHLGHLVYLRWLPVIRGDGSTTETVRFSSSAGGFTLLSVFANGILKPLRQVSDPGWDAFTPVLQKTKYKHATVKVSVQNYSTATQLHPTTYIWSKCPHDTEISSRK